MRYYNIQLSDPDNNVVRTWTSFKNGANDLGALDVEFDIPVTAFDTPQAGSYVRIWGIPLDDISQARSYNPIKPKTTDGEFSYYTISVMAGMKKGLPLANPDQAGLLASGTVQQAFGNWIGTDMTLDLVFAAGSLNAKAVNNLTFSWPAGTSLKAMIEALLDNRFPKFKKTINISDNLTLANAEPSFYGTLPQLAAYIRQVSQAINKDPDYPGVSVYLKNDEFIVTDATSGKNPKGIKFYELIGQPTWLNTATITFSTSVRADLTVGDYITLPTTLATTTAQSMAAYRDSSIFTGSYMIKSVRHVGKFRAAAAESWMTVFQAIAINKSKTTTASA